MFKELKIPFFTVLFIFLGLLIYTKLFGPIPFYINQITSTKNSLFTVDGKGEVAAVPDTAQISVGVTKSAATVASAQEQVNTVIKQLTSDLRNLGVEEKNIKTTNYSVNPNYDYSSGKQTTNGYTVEANLDIKVKPLEKANNAVDIATKDGANQVGNIQFVLDDTKQQQLEDQARQEAITEAKSKAESIARAAGIHLGKIVDVQENAVSPIRPYPMMATGKSLDATAASSTELNPGENKVSTTVTLSYETY